MQLTITQGQWSTESGKLPDAEFEVQVDFLLWQNHRETKGEKQFSKCNKTSV